VARVDLDELERVAASERATVVLDLIAEVRVTREVAEADRWLSESATPERIMRLNRAKAAYREWCDQHGPPPTHGQADAS